MHVGLEMTKLLEQAFAKASELPEEEQDSVAALLLTELESDRRWKEAFVQSRPELAALADEALAEFKEGHAKTLETDSDLAHD